jgi:predicted TPR repeat methyltransferase
MVWQNPSAKIEAKAEAAGRRLESWRDAAMRWVLSFTRHWHKRRDIIANNFTLGLNYLQSSHVRDAVMRFKIVTWMEPARADAWYYLGCSFLAAGERAEAKKALTKSLQLKPAQEEAFYMLAIASGAAMPAEKRPRRIPPALSLAHFEARAAGYTQEQVEVYRYQGHVRLAEAIRAGVVQGRIDHVVLELGVGTGLMGPLIRDITAHLTGVDQSGAMLAEAMKLTDAAGKKIYDALIRRDLFQFLPELKDNAFDIVLAAGTLSYIGELEALFAQVARVLKPSGLFAFTADKMEGYGFVLDPEVGRFRFSQAYLQELAQVSSLHMLKCETVELYPDYPGWLCLFAK